MNLLVLLLLINKNKKNNNDIKILGEKIFLVSEKSREATDIGTMNNFTLIGLSKDSINPVLFQ